MKNAKIRRETTAKTKVKTKAETKTNAKAKAPVRAAAQKGSANGLKGTDPKRVRAILAGLDEAYPGATCALKHRNAFELLIATILSAQCTDVMRQPGHTNSFPEISHARGVGLRQSQRNRGRDPAHGILPQQNEIHHGREQKNPRGFFRHSAAHHGRAANAPRRGAQDRQRGAGYARLALPPASLWIRTWRASRNAST